MCVCMCVCTCILYTYAPQQNMLHFEVRSRSGHRSSWPEWILDRHTSGCFGIHLPCGNQTWKRKIPYKWRLLDGKSFMPVLLLN